MKFTQTQKTVLAITLGAVLSTLLFFKPQIHQTSTSTFENLTEYCMTQYRPANPFTENPNAGKTKEQICLEQYGTLDTRLILFYLTAILATGALAVITFQKP